MGTLTGNREAGFYWVKPKGDEWTIGEWNDLGWWVVFGYIDNLRPDEFLAEIGDKIEPPSRKYPRLESAGSNKVRFWDENGRLTMYEFRNGEFVPLSPEHTKAEP